MPIIDIHDAKDVDEALQRFTTAPDDERRVHEARRLFVETLDFAYADNLIPLQGAGYRALPDAVRQALPSDARRIAERDGVSLAYIPLDAERIAASAINAAAKAVAAALGDDLILLFANRAGDLLHFVQPEFDFTRAAARPRLRRLVIRKGERHRTAVQQLANMWDAYGRQGIPTADAVRQAFSVEPVTQAFFADYRRAFDAAKQAISGFANDSDGEERRHIFAQTLFNRLMFIYFVQRKGWLSYKGDAEYLQALWQAHQARQNPDKNFYADRLRLLFFAGLNNERSEDLTNAEQTTDLIGDVPFLNGGLFAMTEMDSDSRVQVPDEVIQTILADLFDKYNFTVAESTPYDQEVAVDPEMLGKVFEELVTERHESGKYYTPREVVAFMCREALKGYLERQCPDLSAAAIAAFVDDHDAAQLPRSAKPAVSAALDDVRVVDPACGSGAYLLGMMQELLALRDALFNETHAPDPRDEYDRKLHIIGSNLYGVDKDEFAVNIAQLRLWLSLAIEYEGGEPPPLPNLDFKASAGDSLLAPAPKPILQTDMFTERIMADKLGDFKAEYLRSHGGEKRRLADEIKTAERELRLALGDAAAPEGVADWRVLFAEVFARGGFDIALANPPYVRQESSPADTKKALAAQYPDAAVKRSDLYCYFYARALELLREGGVHALSAPTAGWMWATARNCSATCRTTRISAPSTKAPLSGSSARPPSTQSSASPARASPPTAPRPNSSNCRKNSTKRPRPAASGAS